MHRVLHGPQVSLTFQAFSAYSQPRRHIILIRGSVLGKMRGLDRQQPLLAKANPSKSTLSTEQTVKCMHCVEPNRKAEICPFPHDYGGARPPLFAQKESWQ